MVSRGPCTGKIRAGINKIDSLDFFAIYEGLESELYFGIQLFILLMTFIFTHDLSLAILSISRVEQIYVPVTRVAKYVLELILSTVVA